MCIYVNGFYVMFVCWYDMFYIYMVVKIKVVILFFSIKIFIQEDKNVFVIFFEVIEYIFFFLSDFNMFVEIRFDFIDIVVFVYQMEVFVEKEGFEIGGREIYIIYFDNGK